MVTKWGLSEKLGPLTYSDDDGEVFLGHSIAKHKEISESTARDAPFPSRGTPQV